MLAIYLFISAVSTVVFVAVHFLFASYLAAQSGQTFFVELWHIWLYAIATTPVALLAIILKFGERTSLLVTALASYGIFFYAYGIEGVLFCAICTLGTAAYLVTINRIAKEI